MIIACLSRISLKSRVTVIKIDNNYFLKLKTLLRSLICFFNFFSVMFAKLKKKIENEGGAGLNSDSPGKSRRDSGYTFSIVLLYKFNFNKRLICSVKI